jgi:hypothetical protein
MHRRPLLLHLSAKGAVMKTLGCWILLLLLLAILSSCAYFRKENPLNLKCPSCGYIWDRTPTEADIHPLAK